MKIDFEKEVHEVHVCEFCGCKEKRWKPLPIGGWKCDCCGAYWLQDETRGSFKSCQNMPQQRINSTAAASPHDCWHMRPELSDDLKAVAMLLLDAVLDLIQADPHSFSTRPCATCSAVSKIAGRPFGCVAKRAVK